MHFNLGSLDAGVDGVVGATTLFAFPVDFLDEDGVRDAGVEVDGAEINNIEVNLTGLSDSTAYEAIVSNV